jgi:predicted metalloprotease with PDZ domain
MLIFETKSIEMKKSLFIFLFLSCFSLVSKAISVDYQVGMSAPNSHYFEVEMTVDEVNSEFITIKMPVWAPGSYLVREFSKNVNIVRATGSDGKSLEVKKVAKNAWQIASNGSKKIKINYEVYAFELTVRTSFLDDSHGYINGTSVFMYVDGEKETAGTLTIDAHDSFKKIATALPLKGKNVYTYANYDHLVDCPIEIGNHLEFSFKAAGVDHKVAMYGDGNFDVATLQKDMAKIVEAETKIMGENPNENYLFIIHNLTVGSGGLEHSNSTTLQVNRWTYQGADYNGFISLVAHEYFHLWNVKRMRPNTLGPFNYDDENYTDLLWVMEGFTSYYDELVLRRAGFFTEDEYLNKLFSSINYVENQPGNLVQPVAHASFDAWIKSYRPNENSANTTISYYSKGQILAAVLDIYIIQKFAHQKCLDDFLRMLYTDFYKKQAIGYTEAQFQTSLESFLGEDMDWFFDKYVYGTTTLDYGKFFAGVGLNVVDNVKEASPELGIKTNESAGKLMITGVTKNSAAEKQGLSVNDEIIAVDGFRVNKSAFDAMMSKKKNGDELEIILSRDNVIKTYELKMGERKAVNYVYSANFTEQTKSNFNYWLRTDN